MAGEARIECSFSADGKQVHSFSVALPSGADAPERPLGALEDTLDALRAQANEYMSQRVNEDRAALGEAAAAAQDDGWHELNAEGAGDESGDDSLGDDLGEVKKRKRAAKQKPGKSA
mmetsp:Transcript_15701/g.45882  ORF Transcript_15701/g.45882 Transcript_15701/m.45882 type:complete len:117 (+) Transcript_15701:104-454(+)|eukprot:CAMPEP_0206045404 /NCGR_PEP_ID=MMETSP1466-20131121/15770_1 /ASSEMBLY_ACC=CAM_ASM_001126 /TAXON_ID=44452 /ORGANISM="Pavlova gyrans, Strain CCMP608" /LENGTH=116 /DNA_ID=CAMNT_0053420339 /DNA_START=64 /DNA_END=414 /DNA_ORIENTATION=+